MPVYRYVKGREVITEEHMLYLGEIAEIYGLYSKRKDALFGDYPNKPHSLLVKAIILEYMEAVGIMEEDAYYFPAGKGLSRVYPATLYQPAMCFFLEKLDEGKNVGPFSIHEKTMKNGKNFVFVKRTETRRNVTC